MTLLKDRTGERYNRLVVLKRSQNSNYGKVQWLCRCDCGKETIVGGGLLSSGNTKSCGCWKAENGKIQGQKHKNKMLEFYPGNLSAILRMYGGYKIGAKKRGLDFDINIEEFKTITQKPCHYCGIDPSQKITTTHNKDVSYIHNGIDRKNNNFGYIKENVVPCCKTCNYAKGKLTKDEFATWIKRVYKNFVVLEEE